jgi:hypothetical protein
LQKPREEAQAPSMVRERWCGVMVATTFEGRDLTCEGEKGVGVSSGRRGERERMK